MGISHLTTSRRHLGRPALFAEKVVGGYRVNGYCPWVTGAKFADTLVVGATLENGEQWLAAIDTNDPGLDVADPIPLVALQASSTGKVDFHDVFVADENLLAGPVANVMGGATGARTGGLQTSALAIGLARAAIDYLQSEATNRESLNVAADPLESRWRMLRDAILKLASGNDQGMTREALRSQANSLATRASQAALAAAKGAGFVASHPVGRWCRESLFFLVWSCPQGVVEANLCELAGI